MEIIILPHTQMTPRVTEHMQESVDMEAEPLGKVGNIVPPHHISVVAEPKPLVELDPLLITVRLELETPPLQPEVLVVEEVGTGVHQVVV